VFAESIKEFFLLHALAWRRSGDERRRRQLRPSVPRRRLSRVRRRLANGGDFRDHPEPLQQGRDRQELVDQRISPLGHPLRDLLEISAEGHALAVQL
jgi:hypothetical protein